jgi:hypothetical protein
MSVNAGILTVANSRSWVRTHHPYDDFHLECEFRVIGLYGDARLWLRVRPDASNSSATGTSIDLQPGSLGRVSGISKTPAAVPTAAGSWTRLTLSAIGSSLQFSLNDSEPQTLLALSNEVGYVGVECTGDRTVEIRDARITELNHRSLFNGVDLTGWEGAKAPAESCWSVKDGAIECNGVRGTWLRSVEQFGDFNLRLEYAVTPRGNSGIYVRVPADGAHHRADPTLPQAGFEVQVLDDSGHDNLKPFQYAGSLYALSPATEHVGRAAGEWNTLEINCRGRRVKVRHNGVIVVNTNTLAEPRLDLRQRTGYLGLQNHESVVRYRNLRIGPAL